MNTSSTSKAATAPSPDDPRKPDSPADLEKRSWKYVLRKTLREFGKDQCTDLAAALTYYGVLAVAPALLAIVSLLGFVSDPERAVERILGLVDDIAPGGATETIRPILENLTQAPAAGLALVVGLVTALWSASGYVAAFSRGMNRVYEIDEGRPIWKLRPILLLVTLVLVVIAVLVVAMLVLSGGVARTIGDAVGLSDTAVTVWNIAKWPVVVVLVALAIAILYHATPNVRQPKFRWVSVGAVVAIVVWVLASLGFAFYVANFSSYNETYGSLAGVIIALLWLWITNLALLFGAELDAELERGRQLQGGIEAERSIQLPPRDTKASDKKQAKAEDDVRRGRQVREAAQRRQSDDGGDRDRDGGDRGGETRGGSHAARRDG
ncbi:YihY/virulence factor BrkB family protein [Cellulomonas sp. NPDC057328]|uniref:YihY/virulence factor BrkB family protein n=1 Tax=Cellulomonas sp. NPDC057328 TaxID=3346101 RepID=UPI00362C61C9